MLNRTEELSSPSSSAPAEVKGQNRSLGVLAALQHPWTTFGDTHHQQEVSQVLGQQWPWHSCEWAGAWRALLRRETRSQVLTGGASATTSTLLPEMANTLNPNLPAEHHCNHLERSASRQASQIHLVLPIPCSKPPSYLRGKSRLWGRDNTLPLSERLH